MDSITATTVVLMTITMFLPNGKELKKQWETTDTTTLRHCLEMNSALAQGSNLGVLTINCKVIKP